jgi:hypothetical protein
MLPCHAGDPSIGLYGHEVSRLLSNIQSKTDNGQPINGNQIGRFAIVGLSFFIGFADLPSRQIAGFRRARLAPLAP